MKWPFVRRFKLDAVLTVNQVYLDEINRLNKELASELNSHRETKKESAEDKKAYEHNINFERKYNEKLEKELEETKEQIKDLEHDYENEFLGHKETKDALKIAIDDLKNAALCIGEQKTQLEIWKKRSNFYSNNCTEAKESISKVRGILRQIAKKL